MGLKDGEFKIENYELKNWINYFFKIIVVSIHDTERFEQNEMKRK